MVFPVRNTILDDIGASARQQIDEEIASLEARFITLKTTRNALSPIARLHPEVMQEIFVFASQQAFFGNSGKTSLLITWICHGWRALAHKTSALWNYIDFLHLPWIETALSRTRDRPLHFSLS
ncbi:hypothetical protein BDN72DRAFT_772230, partial [Pluteus cervinus]